MPSVLFKPFKKPFVITYYYPINDYWLNSYMKRVPTFKPSHMHTNVE